MFNAHVLIRLFKTCDRVEIIKLKNWFSSFCLTKTILWKLIENIYNCLVTMRFLSNDCPRERKCIYFACTRYYFPATLPNIQFTFPLSMMFLLQCLSWYLFSCCQQDLWIYIAKLFLQQESNLFNLRVGGKVIWCVVFDSGYYDPAHLYLNFFDFVDFLF